jgi:hypothetical protein
MEDSVTMEQFTGQEVKVYWGSQKWPMPEFLVLPQFDEGVF